MAPQTPDAVPIQVEDPVLESTYPRIPIPELETLSACEYLLKSAEENIKLGRTKWLVSANTNVLITSYTNY